MKNYTWLEGGPLRIKGADLYVLPYYTSTKTDPTIKEIMEGLDPAKKAEMTAKRTSGQIIAISNGPDSEIWLLCLSEGAPHFVIKSAFGMLLKELAKRDFHNVVFAQLGLIEYGCDNEEKWKRTQSEAIETYAESHPEAKFTMVIPGDDYRPIEGEHIGEGILPDANAKPEDILDNASHHNIALNTRNIKSYKDYLKQYIAARGNQMELITTFSGETIESVADLQEELRKLELRDTKENFSRWANPTRDKKTGKLYYPVPSKQKLKLMILVLDMSYEEAVACLHFFGYGLARFDREDVAFTYMLRNNLDWPKPIDVIKADATLRKRFGASAALIVKQTRD